MSNVYIACSMRNLAFVAQAFLALIPDFTGNIE